MANADLTPAKIAGASRLRTELWTMADLVTPMALRVAATPRLADQIAQGVPSPRTGMDLRMLVSFGGKERSVAQLAALAAEAGLSLVAVHPAGPMAIVELRAARQA